MENQLNKISIEEIRFIQLNILDYVSAYLDDHNINYYLAYGTLIGALRHSGYIPWDDDIDIVMLRDDYEKLLAMADDFNNDEFEIKHNSLDNKYKYTFMKIVHKGSVVIEPNNYVESPIGINIDIFPFDNLVNKHFSDKIGLDINQLFQRILDIKCLDYSIKRSVLKNIIITVVKVLSLPLGISWLTRRIDRFGKRMSEKESGQVANLVYSNYKNDFVSREAFDQIFHASFEDRVYTAPGGYDEWLKNYYGDYMQLPAEDKRVSHHCCDAYLANEGT